MRRPFTIMCEGYALAATLDEGPKATGLLLVSGGNEIRAGAFNGQARLAAELAAKGHPVLRFDRRGIGDSEGENRGFLHSAPDIRAALDGFRAAVPGLERVVAFGNCDAATALMLASGAGCDALVLSNPWTGDSAGGQAPPPANVLRKRYLGKLARPREIVRLLRGGVDLGKLAHGLRRSLSGDAQGGPLTQEMAAGLAQFAGPVRFLLAEDDRTAQLFVARWGSSDRRIARCPRAGHAYAEAHAQAWLRERLLEALSA